MISPKLLRVFKNFLFHGRKKSGKCLCKTNLYVMRKPSKIGYSKFFYFLFDDIASSAPSPAAGRWVPGGWMGVCWSPGRGHRDRARAWPPAPCLLSDVAMAESTINFLYLINPVNPRSFPMGQKVCSARVTPSLQPGWSGALCGHPAD